MSISLVQNIWVKCPFRLYKIFESNVHFARTKYLSQMSISLVQNIWVLDKSGKRVFCVKVDHKNKNRNISEPINLILKRCIGLIIDKEERYTLCWSLLVSSCENVKNTTLLVGTRALETVVFIDLQQFKKYFCFSYRFSFSCIILIQTWDTFLGHPVQNNFSVGRGISEFPEDVQITIFFPKGVIFSKFQTLNLSWFVLT